MSIRMAIIVHDQKAGNADYILTGTPVIQEKRAWHEGWPSAEKDHNAPNIIIVDPKEKKMLWASEAGDRSW